MPQLEPAATDIRAACKVFLSSMAIVIGPDAAGDRRDVRGHAGNALKVNIAAKTAVGALVNSHVDHDRAGLDPVGRDELGLPHGDEEQIGLAREGARRHEWRCGRR